MKRLLSILLLAVAAFAISAPAFADDPSPDCEGCGPTLR